MKYFYFCNGKACKRNCAENGYAECHHTSDENFAVNKVRRNRKFECLRSKDGIAAMHEI
jgi:hypothetical protein